MKSIFNAVLSPFKQGFTKAEFPNTFINLLAPLVSYTLIPVVTKMKVAQSNISDREKEIVVAQEIPKQAINAAIAVGTFLTGKRLGPGLLKMLGLQKKLSSEGATLVATGVLNFIAYTFVRPLASLALFDQWFNKKYNGGDTFSFQLDQTVSPMPVFPRQSAGLISGGFPARTSFRQPQVFNRAAFSAHPQLPKPF